MYRAADGRFELRVHQAAKAFATSRYTFWLARARGKFPLACAAAPSPPVAPVSDRCPRISARPETGGGGGVRVPGFNVTSAEQQDNLSFDCIKLLHKTSAVSSSLTD